MSSRSEGFRDYLCDTNPVQKKHSLNQERLRGIYHRQERFYDPIPRKIRMAQRRRQRAFFVRVNLTDKELIEESLQRHADNCVEAAQYYLLN